MMKGLWMEVLPPTDHFFCGQNSVGRPSMGSGSWTAEENKLFEGALARYDCDTPDRWDKVAASIPGKTVLDVRTHYNSLVLDVSQIEAGMIPFPSTGSRSFTLDWEMQSYYASGKRPVTCRGSDQERKKGVPWTKEEHRLFLLGLEKYGKGDWRNISRNFVQTRTPTQVASHAQKYFIRLKSGGKDKKRSSIHDIDLTDSKLPSPSKSSAITNATQSSNEASASMLSHFSLQVDLQNPLLSSAVQLPQHVTNYTMNLQAQNLHCSPPAETGVGNQRLLYQI